MRSIAMFNNKGGVGKTTLTCNIASYLSKVRGLKVIVIDCDPQCNSTQLILGREFIEDFYFSREQRDGSAEAYTTISDILSPIEEGDPEISSNIIPFKANQNRFDVDLIPGDPKFSIMEDRLGAAWQDLLKADIGGFRKSLWVRRLLESLDNKYDIVFFDLGPSLGSINRSILLGCDLFVTPMTSDIFSIIGVKNITEWMIKWSKLYSRALENLESDYPDVTIKFSIPNKLPILSGYLGYTLQQYIAKSVGGEKRPTKAYDIIIEDVPKTVSSTLEDFISSGITKAKLKLGDIPHMYSLLITA